MSGIKKISLGFMAFLLLQVSYIAHAEVFIHTMYQDIIPGYGDRFIENLNKAKAGDIITLDINSPGGDLYETIDIMEAMSSTEAYIVCQARNAASGAAMIFMMCDEKKVFSYSLLMWHHSRATDPSTGETLFFRDVPKYIDKDHMYGALMLQSYEALKEFFIAVGLKDLLTEDEWKHLDEGEDVYMTGAEFERRLK